ncbi:MAG: LEPR-XLL domain-containing protein, partial [Nitrospiraceae bacterium]
MKLKKLFTRKTHPRRAPRANKFVLESLEPRLLLSATPMIAAVVTTDHLDYAPGETAVITTSNQSGEGPHFAAGELVQFQVSRTDGMADAAGATANVGPAGNAPWYVIDGVGGFTAHQEFDAKGHAIEIAPDNDLTVNGSISTSWFVEEQYRNSSLLVTAAGQTSGAVATQAFTDAAINTTTVVTSSAPTSTYGDTLTFTATVTAATGTARPVGSVQFFHEDQPMGGIVSISSPGSGLTSIFTISVPTFSANLHGVHAVFTGGTAGADTFNNSTSLEILQTVNPAVATITVAGYDVDYNGVAHTATGTAVGVLGENLSAGLNLSGTIHTNAGANDDIWTFSSTNYTDQSGTVATLIARVDATIAVNGFNTVYSATPPGPSGTPQGLFQGNSLPIPIRDYGTVLDLTATGISNTNSAGLGGLDGFRYVNQLYSANQDVTVTVAGAPTTDSAHYLSLFLRVQNPNTGIVNAYYITYEEAGP